MRRIIRRVGRCTLRPRKDYFVVLCDSIFSQQLSVKIAAILFDRFCALFPRKRPTPPLVLKALDGDAQVLRRCGLSRQKCAYVRDLAQHFVDGRIPTRRFGKMSDQQISDALVAVHGIGRWTAEMFLIFVLNRPDVWPADDLGLQEAVKRAYGMNQRPSARAVQEFGERFRPHRTAATWYLWRSLHLSRAREARKAVRPPGRR